VAIVWGRNGKSDSGVKRRIGSLMGDSRIEKIHIKEFLALVEGLDVYELHRQSPPEPDFWVETNLGLIGIEHTQIFKKIDKNGVDPVAEDRLGNDVLNKAKEYFGQICNQHVHVNLAFRSDYGANGKIVKPNQIQKINRSSLAKEIAEFVAKNIPEPEKWLDFDNPNPFTGNYFLPEIVRSIVIAKYPNISETTFRGMGSHVVPLLENASNLMDALSKKASKPALYSKKYSQTWLVMVTSPFNLTMDFNFERSELPSDITPFDRVFIYRHGDQKYHELQKISE
jgi:hypothetical protein